MKHLSLFPEASVTKKYFITLTHEANLVNRLCFNWSFCSKPQKVFVIDSLPHIFSYFGKNRTYTCNHYNLFLQGGMDRMDKSKLAERNPGRVFNFRCVRESTQLSTCVISKQATLKLQTRPKHLLGYLPLAVGLPSLWR